MGASFSNAVEHLEKEFLLSLKIQENSVTPIEDRFTKENKLNSKKNKERKVMRNNGNIGKEDTRFTDLPESDDADEGTEDEDEYIFPSPLSALSYPSLLSFSFLDGLEVDVAHIAILYVLDADKDGLFSWNDIRNFIEWCQDNVSTEKLDSVNRGEFSDAVHARCILQMWKECTQNLQSIKSHNKRGQHVLLMDSVSGRKIYNCDKKSNSVTRHDDKSTGIKPAVVLSLYSKGSSSISSVADGYQTTRDTLTMTGSCRHPLGSSSSCGSNIMSPNVHVSCCDKPSTSGAQGDLTSEEDTNVRDCESKIQKTVFRDVNNLTDLIVLTTQTESNTTETIQETSDMDHEIKIRRHTNVTSIKKQSNAGVSEVIQTVSTMCYDEVNSAHHNKPKEDLYIHESISSPVLCSNNTGRIRLDASTGSLGNDQHFRGSNQDAASLFVDWMLLFLDNNFPLPCDDDSGDISRGSDHSCQYRQKDDLKGKLSNRAKEVIKNKKENNSDVNRAVTDTYMVSNNNDSGDNNSGNNHCPRPLRYFSLDAIAALHVLLALSDSYGLDLKSFCTILAPQAVADTIGDNNINSDAVEGGDDTTGSDELPGCGIPSDTHTEGYNTDISPPLTPKSPVRHFKCPEESLRVFLSSFINSYWSVLKRFGLKVLL